MSTRFTTQGLVHEHSDDCSHSLTRREKPMDRHQWRKIEYEDDVVPWHCMNCDIYDVDKWDDPCPNPPVGR